MYERYQIKQTFFIPGWTAEHYPETVNSIVEAGHEIALHGYLHEKPNTLSAHEEEYWFMRGLDAIRSVTGVQPRGFRAPNYRFSKHTINYLTREQFLYDSSLMGDDVPYVIEGDSGSLIELPTEWVMDDWPQYTYNSEIGYTAAQFARPRNGGVSGGIRGGVGIWRSLDLGMAPFRLGASRPMLANRQNDPVYGRKGRGLVRDACGDRVVRERLD